MNQELKGIAVMVGLFAFAGGQIYGYMNRGKGRGNSEARDRAALIQVFGAGATAAGTGALLWPVLQKKFGKNSSDAPHEGADNAVTSEDGTLPFMPDGADLMDTATV